MGAKSRDYIFQRETPSGAGERRYATVMFADLAGSTKLIADLEIDEARDLLDSFLSKASEAVHSFGGTIARVQGDGILALFGAPIAKEDHAERAALAALKIKELCKQSEGSANPVSVRVGIHSGELGLRWQSHDFGKSLDVVGATANLAGKVQQCAPLNGVMVSEIVFEQLGPGFVGGEPQDNLLPAEGLTLVELLSHRNREDSFDVQIKQALAEDQIIGRDKYVELLKRSFAADAPCGVTGFTGAPGIGKSRLLLEAEQLALDAGRQILRIVGRSLGRSVPLGALGNMSLKTGADDSAVTSAQQIDFQSELEDFARKIDEWEELSPDARNEQAIRFFIAKIQALDPHGRLIIIVDDFHFLDGETKQLLVRLANHLRDSGGILIIGTRPECQEEIEEFVDTNHILPPLSQEAAHRFVRQRWAASGMEREVLPNTIGQTIQQRAQGMPLALRHFSQHCIALVKEGKDPLLSLPHQLDTIFRSQIDNLDDTMRTVFQTGCVLGYEFEFWELKALSGLAETDLNATLEKLCQAEMLTQIEDARYRFAHQLLQEAGYYGIMRRQRSELHDQAYKILSSASAKRRSSVQVLGWHAARAGLAEQALDHYAQAMKEAIAQGAILTVDELYMQARRLCEQLGETGRAKKAMFLLYSFDALQQMGKQEWYREDVEEAALFFEEQGDAFRMALATCHLAITDWTGGRNRLSLARAREGERLALATGHEPLIIYSQFALGNIEYLCGHPRKGIERLKALVDRLGGVKRTARFGDMISVPGIMARTFSSWYLYDMGEFELARRYCAEGKELAQIINQNYSHVLAELAEAYLLYRDEHFAEASELLEKVVKRCSDQAIYGLETIASARYICSLVREGRLDEAETILHQHRTDGHLAPVQHSCAYYLWEGEARLRAAQGDTEAALAVLSNAWLESERQNDPLHALHGRILSCEIVTDADAIGPGVPGEVSSIRAEAQKYGFLPIVERCDRLSERVSVSGKGSAQ